MKVKGEGAERGKEGTSHCASAANARASGYDTIRCVRNWFIFRIISVVRHACGERLKKIVGTIKYARRDAIDVENKSLAPRDPGYAYIRTRVYATLLYRQTESFYCPPDNKGCCPPPIPKKDEARRTSFPQLRHAALDLGHRFSHRFRFRSSTFLRE